MATKIILKKTPLEVVVKFVGTGVQTLTLAELATANETLTTPTVNIHSVKLSSPTSQKNVITRNAIDILQLYGNEDFLFNSSSLTEQNNGDITVNLGGDGTMILTLRKISGYIDPDTQNFVPGVK